ncbi:50S ribosomal protein L21 [Mangrovimonas yunxiaonensis]|uniref:Large ribosomal subunit protein bL21 n=1 Tax=Mangrovimonas yunxiaonensis TaxID=1197477 RepID=A0A084TLC2_9FLAO|nr:50S ribosomal protein L21 [Mangrovimonas yunxiaonensis]KFB01508.1 50S ribosomal protein L21 [Mangrovimonas yunxiaonensis]MBR9758359.1 50S ribosomal protein L21 [Algicola sp.]GGH36267.1 50S ribosomal protein L21 [Mangrovimonas yunxiaonensis]
MYAIVEIAGQQFKVEKDQKVFVNRLQTEEGKTVSFDNVLLIGDGDNITVGAPAINGAQVGAKVVKHLKGDKVIVFKKKRRKGYRVKNGHRQALSEIVIESIVASGAKKAAPAKKETKKAAPKKAAAKADDLKKIEGVGPKAMEAFVNAGLDTFEKIAATKPEKLSEVLSEASSRLAHLVTDTWPKQAKLAADGKWDELKELQDKLDGGIEQ